MHPVWSGREKSRETGIHGTVGFHQLETVTDVVQSHLLSHQSNGRLNDYTSAIPEIRFQSPSERPFPKQDGEASLF
jgi:hypothetical protein